MLIGLWPGLLLQEWLLNLKVLYISHSVFLLSSLSSLLTTIVLGSAESHIEPNRIELFDWYGSIDVDGTIEVLDEELEVTVEVDFNFVSTIHIVNFIFILLFLFILFDLGIWYLWLWPRNSSRFRTW